MAEKKAEGGEPSSGISGTTVALGLGVVIVGAAAGNVSVMVVRC